jgi:23S rRNA (cytosine1962-C5)-methyltransferase
MSPEVSALLQAAAMKRESLRGHTNALRLVNGYGDGLDGLVLESHGHHFVAQLLESRWLEEKEALADFVKGLGAEYFIIKDRTRSTASRPEEIPFHVMFGDGSTTIDEEYGLKFKVDMNDTLNTGLFLDMRANRRIVATKSAGCRVLNLFAYTCSFGVHCRAAGATAVVNVDVSKKILERGRVNYELNGFVGEKNEFIRADAVEYLERAVRKDNRFDMIILDPPSFARHEGRIFSVMKDLPGLVKMAVQVLNPGGFLFVSSNYSEMLFSHLQNVVKAAAKGRHLKEMRCLGQDTDFEGSGAMAESCLTAVLAEL